MFVCGILLAVAARPASGQSGETGNVCVHQGSPGVSCTGDAVLAESLGIMTLHEACDEGEVGSALVTLEGVLSAVGSPSSNDVSVFLALNGDSALEGGHCYHDYLAPPLTTTPVYGDADANGVPDLVDGPWVNLEPQVQSDRCGDIEATPSSSRTWRLLEYRCASTASTRTSTARWTPPGAPAGPRAARPTAAAA